MHLVDCVLQHRYRLADVVVDDGQVEEVAIRLPQHVRLLRQPLQAAVVLWKGTNLVGDVLIVDTALTAVAIKAIHPER